MAVIELSGLRKEYRRLRRPPVVALNGLDLSVPDGGVFGFLGPNGSGKTTTIRCLLALARPTAGHCRVLGVDSQAALPQVIARIGSMVETPGLFPAMSGRKNLALLGRIQGIGPSTVANVLDRVGLAERADDPVRGYSLGMRQRLGIGIALSRTPSSSSSTSRPTASTPPASRRCGSCCGAWAPRAGPCSCPATC